MCSGSLCLQGNTRHSGNVMVDDKPVCDDDWGLEDAAVVCRQLGFVGVERATRESEFGTVSSSYKMDNVKCYGNETDLRDCNHKAGDDCDGNEAAGVVCSTVELEIPDSCKNDETICLLGGTPGSGNVYYQGKPVCHNGWDFPDANVVCKALGFAAAVNFTIRSHFGLSNTYFSLSNVNCRGDEAALYECPHDTRTEGCETDSVAGVMCIGASVDKLGNTGMYSAMVLGLGLATIGLLLVVGFIVIKKLKNKKLLMLERTDSVIPSLSFKNPIVKTTSTVPIIENPQMFI